MNATGSSSYTATEPIHSAELTDPVDRTDLFGALPTFQWVR